MIRRSLSAALFALFALSACSDGNAPDALQLTEAQAEDLMEALSSVGAVGLMRQDAYRVGDNTQAITVTVDETEPCPNGGTARVQGTFNANDAGTQMTAALVQSYSACKATSNAGRMWTFDGAPNVASNITMTANETTGAFSMNGTQKGAIDASSDIGSGRCVLDLTYTATGNEITGSFSMTMSGSVCGRTISISVSEP